MKKILLALITALLFVSQGDAGELPVSNDAAKTVPTAVGEETPKDVNNPENTLPMEQQPSTQESRDFKKKTDRPVSAHKVN